MNNKEYLPPVKYEVFFVLLMCFGVMMLVIVAVTALLARHSAKAGVYVPFNWPFAIAMSVVGGLLIAIALGILVSRIRALKRRK